VGVFFADWCGPKQVVVDPRKNIRLSWFYYIDDPATDDPLQYFKILWKPTTVKGWTDSAVKSTVVPSTERFYDVASGTWTLGQAYSWRIEAWVIDKDYDADVTPGPGVPTGDPFVQSSVNMTVDANGYDIWTERDGVVSSGSQGSASISQLYEGFFKLVPSDPGEYEVRFKVRNGFQWSAYSTTVQLVQYDTRRWVKKSNIWNAVPGWTKKSGGYVRTRT
jgi:hypothetical protein